MRWTWLVIGLAAAALPAREAGAQPAARAAQRLDADFEECDAAAASKSKDRMEAAVQRLEAAAAALESERPADALVVRARVLSQCRIPFAGFMRQGALVEESNELLERALQLEPTHLVARFTLGMNHYHSPAFLRRTNDAVRELERVLADHGERADPVVALAYLYLGMLYERQGRAALAASTWRRGAERFPEHAALREKAASSTRGSDGDDVDANPSAPLQSAGEGYTLAPIVVHASTVSVGEPRGATRLSQQEVFTLPGGTADIFQVFQTLPGVTRVAGDGGDRVTISVRDTGPGVPPAERARIFEPFHTASVDGTGLGLSVVRRIARELDWQLEVDDAPGGGAEFRIRLPAAATSREPATRAALADEAAPDAAAGATAVQPAAAESAPATHPAEASSP